MRRENFNRLGLRYHIEVFSNILDNIIFSIVSLGLQALYFLINEHWNGFLFIE